jgi:hypothetical protein
MAAHFFFASLLAIAVWPALTSAIDSRTPFRGAQAVNQWKLQRLHSSASSSRAPPLLIQTPGTAQPADIPVRADVAAPTFPVYTFEQPLDHFFNTTNATFGQRYWVSTRHYIPNSGAPVIVIDGGETSGEDRLPFLDTGIADILAKATGGVGVVLEHRYYGAWSLPSHVPACSSSRSRRRLGRGRQLYHGQSQVRARYTDRL